MRPARKSKLAGRNAARLTRTMTRSEDDAEQALKEIVAIGVKSAASVTTAQEFCEKNERKALGKECPVRGR